MTKRILVTGGLGFIGGNFVDFWHKKYPKDKIIIADALTYAADPHSIEYVQKYPSKVYPVNLAAESEIRQLFDNVGPIDSIFHFAAETHVCRSIEGPRKFMESNVLGTFNLLEELRIRKFTGRVVNILTDEIFGELGPEGKFSETTNLAPTSPYSASKASQKIFGDAYSHTYKLDIVNVSPTNNFGPRQHEEKLIPRVVKLILENKPVTIYRPGTQVRDWLYVIDHCEAIETVYAQAKAGELYCVGGDNEINNVVMVGHIHKAVEKVLNHNISLELVFTDDRPTDDFRYAVDNTKIESLGWKANKDNFIQNLNNTVEYFIKNYGNN